MRRDVDFNAISVLILCLPEFNPIVVYMLRFEANRILPSTADLSKRSSAKRACCGSDAGRDIG
jgi:hypothetical protein